MFGYPSLPSLLHKLLQLSYEGRSQDQGSSTDTTDNGYDEYGFKVVEDGFYSKIIDLVWTFHPHKEPENWIATICLALLIKIIIIPVLLTI